MSPAFSFRRKAAVSTSLVAASLCLLLTGCVVKVDKSGKGAQKQDNVSVLIPFGGVHVQSNQTTAADLGLPVYPGAVVTAGNGNDNSANVDLGFGGWQMRVKVVHYSTPDARDKVVAFYRKALGQFGTVIACNGDSAQGKPSVTDQGLTCDEGHHHVNVNIKSYNIDSDNGFNLRTGSVHHQHIVAFDSDDSSGTKFTLVELVLPTGSGNHGTPD